MTTANESPTSDSSSDGMISCNACNKEIHFSASACPHCGAQRRTSRYKSKTVAALFALFLGGFGGHRFYLGQWWGVFYLLFFWLWLPGIIAIVEFVYFLMCDSVKWDDRYNEGIPAGPNDKSSGVLIAIVIIVGGFFFIAIIGILAAIAIPSYHEYTLRAKVQEALNEVEPLQGRIERHYFEKGTFPEENLTMGLQSLHIISGSHTVTITLNGIRINFGDEAHGLNSETLILSPEVSDATISWRCDGGTLVTLREIKNHLV
ncbi:MAG: NINE protein [Pseudomonadales bacterium]|nr:NINE protein [Pseudomonadales bacterium]